MQCIAYSAAASPPAMSPPPPGGALSARHDATPAIEPRAAAKTTAGSQSSKRGIAAHEFGLPLVGGNCKQFGHDSDGQQSRAAASTTFCKPVPARLSQSQDERNGCRGEQQSFHDFQIEAYGQSGCRYRARPRSPEQDRGNRNQWRSPARTGGQATIEPPCDPRPWRERDRRCACQSCSRFAREARPRCNATRTAPAVKFKRSAASAIETPSTATA